jgi:hypothetical protein
MIRKSCHLSEPWFLAGHTVSAHGVSTDSSRRHRTSGIRLFIVVSRLVSRAMALRAAVRGPSALRWRRFFATDEKKVEWGPSLAPSGFRHEPEPKNVIVKRDRPASAAVHRVLASVVLERPPIVIPPLEPWQQDWADFQLRLRAQREHVPKTQLDEDQEPVLPRVDSFYRRPAPLPRRRPSQDDLMRMETDSTVRSYPRITLDDERDDRRSLNRKLWERLYLIVRRNRPSFQWSFPQAAWREGESLRLVRTHTRTHARHTRARLMTAAPDCRAPAGRPSRPRHARPCYRQRAHRPPAVQGAGREGRRGRQGNCGMAAMPSRRRAVCARARACARAERECPRSTTSMACSWTAS